MKGKRNKPEEVMKIANVTNGYFKSSMTVVKQRISFYNNEFQTTLGLTGVKDPSEGQ